MFPVKAGDTLDGVYKVESVSAERIELVYLPLGTPNHIVVSSALDAERAQPPRGRSRSRARGAGRGKRSGATSGARPASLGRAESRCRGRELQRHAAREHERAAARGAVQLRFAPDVLQPVNVRPGKFSARELQLSRQPEGSIFVGASSPAAAAGNDAELVIDAPSGRSRAAPPPSSAWVRSASRAPRAARSHTRARRLPPRFSNPPLGSTGRRAATKAATVAMHQDPPQDVLAHGSPLRSNSTCSTQRGT